MVWTIGNEVGNKAAYAGTEAVTGTPVAATHQWLGELSITKTQDLVTAEEATGGYHRQVTPQLGLPTFAGTYAENLTFESLPIHMQYALKAGAAGVGDSETVEGFTYAKSPDFNRDDIASATVRYGIDGLAWMSTGVRHNEFTINIDVDDADGVWKFNSNLAVGSKQEITEFDGVATGGTTTTVTMTGASWTVDEHAGKFVFVDFGTHIGDVRLIASNTEDELTVDEAFDTAPAAGTVFRIEGNLPSIAVPDYEKIPTYGTMVFIDEVGSIGETLITDRIINVSLSVNTNRTTKRFLDNPSDQVSKRSGRGAQAITGSIRVELDRRDEYVAWQNLQERSLRIEQLGSVIDDTACTTKEAYIELPRVAFGTPTEDARENNMTLTVPFTAYLPEAEPILTIGAKNEIANLDSPVNP